MRVSIKLMVLSASVLALTACRGKSSSSNSTPPPQPQSDPTPAPAPDPKPDRPNLPLTLQPTLGSIQHELVDKKCVACHSEASVANRHVALSDLSKVILPPNVPAAHDHTDPRFARNDLVREGCPDQSFFYTIMKEGTMPPRAQHVSAEDLTTVASWIKSLGPADPPADLCKDPTEPGDDDDAGGPGS